MHHPAITSIESPGPVSLAAKWRTAFIACVAVGLLSFGAAFATNPERAWHGYLLAYYMFLCFGMVGLFFTALHHAVNASWVIVVRRIAEGLTAYLPIALILYVGIIFGSSHLYDWAGGGLKGIEGHEGYDVTSGKYRWLSLPWVATRDIIFLLIWNFFARVLVGLSLKQDTTKNDPALVSKMAKWSIAFLIIFAITFTLFSIDLILSLESKYYSTMFGVYCFAGLFQSGLALITIIFIWMRRHTKLSGVTTPSHLKDLGGLLFAFSVFMCYIGFSQYMLTWYANLPEENFYFIQRQDHGWGYLFAILPVFKFFIPFFGLASQALKKNEKWLFKVCWVIIIGQFLDLYWLIMPAYSKEFVAIGWMELGTWVLFLGIFGLSVSGFYAKNSILATGDPRILASANWRFWD